MAERLTEDTNYTVAVIEAGSFYEFDNANYSQIPAYDTYYSSASPSNIQPLVDWGIITVPQKSLNNRKILYAQGKCLGGGSARNYMAYHRGPIGAFDQWSERVGDSDYSFANLLPYFQRSVNFTAPNYAKRGPASEITYDADAFNSSAGPLHVSYTNYWQPLSQFIKSGFSKLGLKPIRGFNSGQLIGFSEFTLTIDPSDGSRSSSETSFLQNAIRKSASLQIYHRTFAKKILFDGNKTAVGVLVTTDSVEYTLHARREVLVAAGAFRSPQILMTSGVGPQDTLTQLNISCISNLTGVGQNLQDQPLYSLSYRVNVTTESQLRNNPDYAAKAAIDFYTDQTGPLQSGGGNFVGRLLQSIALR
ncbi:MAG: hypothetical protein Q9157_002188 [Trypethelium eluteriae]